MIYFILYLSVAVLLLLSVLLYRPLYKNKKILNDSYPMIVALVTILQLGLLFTAIVSPYFVNRIPENHLILVLIFYMFAWCVEIFCMLIYAGIKTIQHIQSERWRVKHKAFNIFYLLYTILGIMIVPNVFFGLYYSLFAIYTSVANQFGIYENVYIAFSVMFDSLPLSEVMETYKRTLSEYPLYRAISLAHLIVTYLIDVILLGLVITRLYKEVEKS